MSKAATVVGTAMQRAARTPYLMRKSLRTSLWHAAVYAVLIVGAVFLFIPLVFTLSTSLKDQPQIFAFPPRWIPERFVWENYPKALQTMHFGRSLLNTMRIVIPTVAGSVLTASMAGYAFARVRFRLRDTIFLIMLSTIMLPWEVTMIPVFHIFKYLGWINTLKPLQIPPFLGGSPFYIFLLRQFFSTIPSELEDAAQIDGCGTLAIYWRIFLPLSASGLAAVAIFSFMDGWNDFLGPLIYLDSPEKRPLTLALYLFRNLNSTAWAQLMAASLVCMIPPIVLYFFAQRYFIQGIVFTGVKS